MASIEITIGYDFAYACWMRLRPVEKCHWSFLGMQLGWA